MFTVVPPKGPQITGGKMRYSLGDLVDVNCTSANSKPAADILWFINGQPVSLQFLHGHFRFFLTFSDGFHFNFMQSLFSLDSKVHSQSCF